MRTRIKQKNIHLWSTTAIILCLILIVILRQNVYDKRERSSKRESMPYEQLTSRLWNEKKCYLCGKNKKSLMGYYRKFDTLGVICLCDWYVLDLGLHENDDHISFGMINVGDISIMESSLPDKRMATMDINIPQDRRPDIEMLQKNLCQDCLDDVIDTLQISDNNYETAVYPLCLVNLKTLDV